MNVEKVVLDFDFVILKLGNFLEINYIDIKLDGVLMFCVKSNEYFIFIGGVIDVEVEIVKLFEEL